MKSNFYHDPRKLCLIEALNDSGWKVFRESENKAADQLRQRYDIDEVWLVQSEWTPSGFQALIVWDLFVHPGAEAELAWVSVYLTTQAALYERTPIRLDIKHWPKRGLKEFLRNLSSLRELEKRTDGPVLE